MINVRRRKKIKFRFDWSKFNVLSLVNKRLWAITPDVGHTRKLFVLLSISKRAACDHTRKTSCELRIKASPLPPCKKMQMCANDTRRHPSSVNAHSRLSMMALHGDSEYQIGSTDLKKWKYFLMRKHSKSFWSYTFHEILDWIKYEICS
jgi:hypothetical protein